VRWLGDNGLGHGDYMALIRDTHRRQHVRALHRRGIATALVRLLRSRGRLPSRGA
jgi:hypothetical protein